MNRHQLLLLQLLLPKQALNKTTLVVILPTILSHARVIAVFLCAVFSYSICKTLHPRRIRVTIEAGAKLAAVRGSSNHSRCRYTNPSVTWLGFAYCIDLLKSHRNIWEHLPARRRSECRLWSSIVNPVADGCLLLLHLFCDVKKFFQFVFSAT